MTTELLNISPLDESKKQVIANFWLTVKQNSFITKDKCKIAYAVNFTRPHKPFIVIIPGRTEAYLKYQELVYDLDVLGFDSVVIDHRGQGLSQRLLKNPHKGYVLNFDDYASDLHQLLADEIPTHYKNHPLAYYMLSHSMGGAIALRYLQTYQSNALALSLNSPMIAIATGALPYRFAKGIVALASAINQLVSKEPWYFFGQNDQFLRTFNNNPLTHCQTRFDWFMQRYTEEPSIELGGVTLHWLKQAIKAHNDIFKDINKLTVPIMLQQSGADSIVDNTVQFEFCQALAMNNISNTNKTPVVIAGAYHELFFEKDEYRNLALNNIVKWFNKIAKDHTDRNNLNLG